MLKDLMPKKEMIEFWPPAVLDRAASLRELREKPLHRHNELVVSQSRLFLGILPQDYENIRVVARVKEFPRGDRLFMETEPVRQVFVVSTGLVKVTQVGLSGSEATLRLAVPGDIIDSASAFSEGKHTSSAQAIRNCQALVWDTSVFKRLEDTTPQLRQNRLHILSSYILELEERFRELATERVALRVARQLVRLAAKMGHLVDGLTEVSLTRLELAEMTGTTLFTVSRLLSDWEARGLVTPRREGVVILNVEALKAISD